MVINDEKGFPKPLRIAFEIENKLYTFTSIKIFSYEYINRNGIKYHQYIAEASNDTERKVMEIRFYPAEVRWVLYKC